MTAKPKSEMPFTLPQFQNDDCHFFAFYAIPQGDWSVEHEQMATRYRPPVGSVFLEVGRNENSGNLTVDCRTGRQLGKIEGSLGKRTHTKSQVSEYLASFVGREAYTSSFGSFLIPTSGLPEQGFIRFLGNWQENQEVSLRLSAGTVNIKGAPTYQIEWSIGETAEPETVQIFVSLRNVGTTLSPDYLQRAFEETNLQFQFFVLGKHK